MVWPYDIFVRISLGSNELVSRDSPRLRMRVILSPPNGQAFTNKSFVPWSLSPDVERLVCLF